MTIDINKKYRTRNGREVRIYATDAGGQWPIHGAVKYDLYDCWLEKSWDENGDSPYQECNLVEAKPRIKQKVWVNVYPDHCLGAYHEKRHADEMAAPHRLACIEIGIDCEEGEGL